MLDFLRAMVHMPYSLPTVSGGEDAKAVRGIKQVTARQTEAFLPGLDGRTRPALRRKRIRARLIADLGHAPSEFELSLIDRAAAALVACEHVEAEILSGRVNVDMLAEQGRLGNLACRLLKELGIRREAPRVSLDDYLAQKREREAAS